MHVGDEFFLSLLYPIYNYKNREITFDNWDLIKKKDIILKNKINEIWIKAEKRIIKYLNKKISIFSKKNNKNNKNNKEKH